MAVSVGIVVLIIIVVLILLGLIILGIIFLVDPGILSSGSNKGVTVINNRTTSTSSVADFKPITLTQCDLKKICDDSSSSCSFSNDCGMGKCNNCNEKDCHQCNERNNRNQRKCNGCNDHGHNGCVEVPCPLGKNCRSQESVDPDSCGSDGNRKNHSCEDLCSCSFSTNEDRGCESGCGSESDLWQPPKMCCQSEESSCTDVCDSLDFHCNQKDFFTSLDLKVVEFCDSGSGNSSGNGLLKPDQIEDITNLGNIVIALRKNDSTRLIMKQVKGFKKSDFKGCIDCKIAKGEQCGKCRQENQTIKCPRDKGKQCNIKSNLSLTRIIAFQGTLFAISGGKLFQQDPTSVGKKTIFWFEIENMPTGIVWITKTADDKYLWIQNATMGFLLNCKRKIVDQIKIDQKIQRIFGRTISTVADLDTQTHTLNLVNCNKKFVNIGSAIFNFNNEVIFVREKQSDVVTGIRLVLFQPYYLLR